MKEQKITKASLLQSKAKIMADRNERFAVIKQEIDKMKEELIDNLNEITDKISKVRST